MPKKIIQIAGLPKAVGPYNQVVAANGFYFCSGQIPLNPQTGELVPGGIKEQTKQVLENIKSLLNGLKKDFQDVVKTTVFMVDLAQFAEMNTIYQEVFSRDFPARSTVQVAALPKGALIEIEVIVAE